MNFKKSLYHRAKNFIENTDLENALTRNKLNDTYKDIPLELIDTMETIKNFKLGANTLLDIGCHKGLFSKVANAFFKFDKTICFEPNNSLHAQIKLNNSGNKFVIEDIALSDQEGQTAFYMHQDNSMNSIVEAENAVLEKEFPWDNPNLMEKNIVKTTTLDNYVSNNALTQDKFFIKIDTQGNELNILKKGIDTLKRTEICLIEFMFTTPYKSDFYFYDLVKFMEENHFDCKGAVSISKRPSKKISAVDFLFVNKGIAN
jgi:FkbM family methyltransferase